LNGAWPWYDAPIATAIGHDQAFDIIWSFARLVAPGQTADEDDERSSAHSYRKDKGTLVLSAGTDQQREQAMRHITRLALLLLAVFLAILLGLSPQSFAQKTGTETTLVGRFQLFQGTSRMYVQNDKGAAGLMSNTDVFKIDTATGQVWRYAPSFAEGKTRELWIKTDE
jgi:hypothetical protein